MDNIIVPQDIEEQATYWYVRIRSPELTPQQESEFFLWLEASSLHQAAFIRIDQAWSAGAALATSSKNPAATITRGWGYGLSAAATVLIAVLLVYMFPLNQRESTTIAEKFSAFSEQRTIALADSSSLVLSPNSDLEVRYSQSTRELHLNKGEIFLKVAPDTQRPFRVIAGQRVIQVIGTQFSVQQLADDLKIIVVDGLVGLLKDKASADQDPMLVLSKNQQILYSEALKGAAPTLVDAGKETSWTKGRMIFDGTPLVEVTAALNKHLSLPILIASPELEDKRIVGAISIKDPRAAASSLASITGAVVEATPDKKALALRSAKD